jgi:hypothetical protein
MAKIVGDDTKVVRNYLEGVDLPDITGNRVVFADNSMQRGNARANNDALRAADDVRREFFKYLKAQYLVQHPDADANDAARILDYANAELGKHNIRWRFGSVADNGWVTVIV